MRSSHRFLLSPNFRLHRTLEESQVFTMHSMYQASNAHNRKLCLLLTSDPLVDLSSSGLVDPFDLQEGGGVDATIKGGGGTKILPFGARTLRLARAYQGMLQPATPCDRSRNVRRTHYNFGFNWGFLQTRTLCRCSCCFQDFFHSHDGLQMRRLALMAIFLCFCTTDTTEKEE